MGFEIEKGVPLPESGGRRSRSVFRDMEVGDSVFVAATKSASTTGHYAQIAKTTGFKFTSRKVEGGVRVWRIA